MGEIEHKLNKASDKTEGTTHKSTEIKNNIGEKKQEIRELEKIREKLINENNVIKKYRSSDPCEAEIDNEGRLAGFLEYYLEGTREDPRTPDSLSEQRLHKLIYLTELLLIRKELHPPLRIDFRPFIDGIFSKEVHESLSELDTVNKRPVYVKGNNVTKCTTNSVKTNLEESDKEIARRIFRNCKHLNSSKITDTVRATPPFSGTKYGVEMGLRTLYE